jgi:hypothetical protein
MPFTVSHAAAVLPVSRPLSRWHVLSAAVIGSMTPDLNMLLPGWWPRWSTHSLPGLLTFCLPLGLFVYWLTQYLLKPAVAEVLPPPQQMRLRQYHPVADIAAWRTWLAAAAAILFGAFTHLLWDAFTHEYSRGVQMFPELRDYGPDVGGHPLRLYRWLQYGSSVVGLLAVLIALWLWYRRVGRSNVTSASAAGLAATERAAWLALYAAVPLIALGVRMLRLMTSSALPSAGGALANLAVLGMRTTALSLVAVSVLLRLRLGTRWRA